MQNNKGVTLPEMIITLLLFSLWALAAAKFSSLFLTEVPVPDTEARLFVQQMEEDMQNAQSLAYDKQRFYIKSRQHTYEYFMSNGRVIRRVDNEGFEIMLQGASSFFVETEKYGADVEVILNDGQYIQSFLSYHAATKKLFPS
ncbi:competence type IV pilus minor pilin ComGF [uncultured Marinococcus sp.]|uniref:competence type IV pilus minor pilin ComGF n=1 Tax=uncultured Marinococcus sp. TaxID=487012 RepID=UPI0026374B0F|nr:competence type IV pilus minor pilin ComGF [uncultured Marinococcus sp.]